MNRNSSEVCIDFPLSQAKKGLYFIGQTPILSGQTGTAQAALCNPCNSGRLIYVNAITITNISNVNLAAEFILSPIQTSGSISTDVLSTNTSCYPMINPVGTVESFAPPVFTPANGVSIFSRIVPPESTLVVDGGQIILGQNICLFVYIGGFSPVSFDGVRFAFGWSEEELYQRD